MVHIRSVKEGDFEKLAGIYAEAYNTLNIGEKWQTADAQRLLTYFYTKQPDLFFVAEENEKLIGGITAFIKPWWDGVHLTDGELFVHPDSQGHGVGTKLIKKLFTEAKESYKAVSWDTFTHRVYEHPLKWYKSIGFEEIDEWVMITGDIEKVLDKLKEE